MKKLMQFFGVVLFAAVPMMANAHGPIRQVVKETVQINASPEKVWAMVKDFSALEKWHPAIASTKMLDDKTRLLTLKSDRDPAPTITEELQKVDDDKMTLVYKITDMSVLKTITFDERKVDYQTLPVNNYKAWIKVEPSEGGSKVTWQAKFYRAFLLYPPIPEGLSDKDAVDAITGVARTGLDQLKNVMEQ